MFKHSLLALLATTCFAASAAPVTATFGDITLSVSADESSFTSITQQDGWPSSASHFNVTRTLGDVGTTPFTISFSTPNENVTITTQVSIVWSPIPNGVFLFSLPYTKLVTSSVGATKVNSSGRSDFFQAYAGPNGIDASISIDIAEAFGGIGVTPAYGTNCASIECMNLFRASKTLSVDVWMSPAPEPENIALAIAGMATMVAIGSRRRAEHRS